MPKENIKFLKFSSKEVASYYVASSIYRWFNCIASDKIMVLGTATGQTPVLTYKELLKLAGECGWFKDYANTFILRQLDNYISPDATEENLPEYSYELELKNSIWKIPNGGTYIPKEYAEDPEKEAEKYAKIIRDTNDMAHVIVQILGIGDEDGHIAFNMPGDSFDSTVHVVELNEETIRANAKKFFGGDTTKVPRRAITTGIGDILESDVIIMEAFGAKKADIIWKSFFTEPTTDIPATALQTATEDKLVMVVLDEDSASVISAKEGYIFDNPENVIAEYIYEHLD